MTTREDVRTKFMKKAGEMFDALLPADGSFPDTTINEIEDRVVADGQALEQALLEYRLELEGASCATEAPDCPHCGQPMRIVEEHTRRVLETTVGGVDYGRNYCACDRCQVAFPPSG